MLVRGGRKVYHTTPVQHFWDCPLQFAASPDFAQVSITEARECRKSGSGESMGLASRAETQHACQLTLVPGCPVQLQNALCWP